jgi:hypothetical protein
MVAFLALADLAHRVQLERLVGEDWMSSEPAMVMTYAAP